MADYIVNFADPSVPAITIHPKQVDGPGNGNENTSLRLFGDGHTSWGEAVNENFVKLLETFQSATPPVNPTPGQLWLDYPMYHVLFGEGFWFFMFDVTSGTWVEITADVIDSATIPPASPTIGVTYWWDSDVYTLYWFASANDGVPASWMVRSYTSENTEFTPLFAPLAPVPRLKVFDGGMEAWQLVGAALAQNGDMNQPSATQAGSLWFNTTNNTLSVANGGNWVRLLAASNPTLYGSLNLNNNSVINVADAVNPQDALNLRTGNSLYVNVVGDTMTGDLNLGANQLNFTNMFLNEGNGDDVSVGPDIRFTGRGMLAAAENLVMTVDSADIGTGDFIVSKGSLITSTDVPLLTVSNNGRVSSNVASYETLVTTNAVLTNKKYVDDAAAGSMGKQTIWIPASALTARGTSGAAPVITELPTNKVSFKTLNYDTGVEEFAQFFIRMPKSWNESTITAQVVWSHASTTVNFGVVWGISAVSFSNGDALDVAFGTEQVVVGVGGVADVLYHTSETPAIAVAGSPVANDVVAIQISRKVSNVSDTMGIDARLHGVVVYYTTDALNDA